MEKMEYRNRIEEMKALISNNKFADAMAVADTINWRKVHNINDLIAGSESYEAVGKIDEARDLLLLAHERSPIGRMILYKLCMISIKLKELDEAQEYYNEFVQIAPHDSLKYILKYNINTAKGADSATLITILEQLKESDFIEEWAYELAYLYHKTNQAEKCISLCDEIILWFGDGPVVERALELKMLYQPLDKAQEDKYRSLQQKKDGIVEITPKPMAESSEILPAIADIKLPEGPERFDTINLQAEIKKNIDEIMKATDTGEVTENIDAIKTLVEEIPYLQVTNEETSIADETDNFSVNDTFQQYLSEGYDGQISLVLDDESTESEEQIEGQMTIEDVLAEWEKTKRAAEAAMEDAKEKELESARARALREANNVLNRLEGAMSKLNAGMTSSDLLKEEYLSNTDVAATAVSDEETPVETEITEEAQTEEKESGFSIPKLDVDGLELGSIDIPVVKTGEANVLGAVAAGGIIQAAGKALEETTNWEPPTLDEGEEDEVDLKEASELIADVNKMLQQEIDRLTTSEEEPAVDATDVDIQEAQINIDDIELPVIEIPEDLLAEIPSASISESEVYSESEAIIGSEVEEELPIISENVLEPQEIAELVDEKVLTDVIKEEVPNYNLDAEDLETFSYFLPISGMKESIVQVLTGAVERIKQPELKGGNIVIVGEPGSGKTQMATSIIKVLEKKTGYPKGGIGKISGEKLNEKDIQKLYSKIQGGCLIIETAGDISKETAVTLSLLMEQDNTGTIIIIEDNKRGIEKALTKDGSFAKRFTEKIVIPAFTIDELVSFARTYAYEAGCSIDDMGVLALYNRINLIGRYNHATTIKEVAEIMDGAIEKSTRGGFFNKPKYDRDGNIILKEKDFDK
ncbi:hypothetical protein [Pseudobutyrivibrio xylanivorans]|uniref:AAA+ ATPase domain-containing protein n=1 Tax=Pseudobutyrivibrio xylanivorans DSM 14809 TaxID=1123012 RepID=A0A1M6IVP9_PSEXY|nr:hypothetical protein [Pseudobutyrivibrio xylanivorans]SHJ38512.1 hypothetical protein SAMN02745725_02437 [Pseudobutyrivibrio xylanivorans DSM 14809]